MDANANKRQHPLRPCGGVDAQLRGEIEGLFQAEHADTDDVPDPQGLPEELSRRDIEAGRRGVGTVRRRGRKRAEYERKVVARERRTGSRKGRHIKPPTTEGADQPDGRGQCADAQEPAP